MQEVDASRVLGKCQRPLALAGEGVDRQSVGCQSVSLFERSIARRMCCKGSNFAAAAGAVALWTCRRASRVRVLAKEKERAGMVHLPHGLSEEEVVSYELADEDFSLCEEEDEEWRQYDEEVSQFKKLVLECGSDLSSSSRSAFSRLGPSIRDSQDLPGPFGDCCSEAILPQNESGGTDGQSQPSALVFGEKLTSRHFELPREYRQRLENEGTAVVVTTGSGENALVLLSHVPDQPQLLPVVSETFRMQEVKLVRGWLETMDDGVVMGAFEVSDLNDQPLSSERTAQLERALMQAGRGTSRPCVTAHNSAGRVGPS